MKSKERPWALTKEGLIHEVKKDRRPKIPKRRKKKGIIIIIIKKKEKDLDQARGRIPVRLEEGSRSGQRICSKKKDPSQTRGYVARCMFIFPTKNH